MPTTISLKKVSASPKQVAMNKFPAANISNKVKSEEKTNDNSMAHLEGPVFLPLSLPPKIQRNTLSSTYVLTRSGQTDLSNLHTFTYRTSPSRSTREISPASSRGDTCMSKQTTDTPICSNLTPKNLESSVSFTDSPERPPQQKRYRFVKSRSLLRRLTSVLHRTDRVNDRALLDDELDLDEEIPIQDVFTQFNEEKEEKEFVNEEKEEFLPPPLPPIISRPSTPVVEVDDSASDSTPIPSSPADPTPVFSSKMDLFSSKLDTTARRSTLASDCSVPSVARSTGSMSSISCEWGRGYRRGCNSCKGDDNNDNDNDDTCEFPEETTRTRYERGQQTSYRYKTDGSASTKSSDLDLFLSCVDSAMETLCEGLAFCFPSRKSKKSQ